MIKKVNDWKESQKYWQIEFQYIGKNDDTLNLQSGDIFYSNEELILILENESYVTINIELFKQDGVLTKNYRTIDKMIFKTLIDLNNINKKKVVDLFVKELKIIKWDVQ